MFPLLACLSMLQSRQGYVTLPEDPGIKQKLIEFMAAEVREDTGRLDETARAKARISVPIWISATKSRDELTGRDISVRFGFNSTHRELVKRRNAEFRKAIDSFRKNPPHEDIPGIALVSFRGWAGTRMQARDNTARFEMWSAGGIYLQLNAIWKAGSPQALADVQKVLVCIAKSLTKS